MATLSISETQFAFSYFHKFSLLNKNKNYEFVFPTLKQEGNPQSTYAGADVVVCKNLFLQFKVPEYLKTYGTVEFYSHNAANLFDAPFFRIRVKNKLLNGKLESGQFDMLRKVAKAGKSAQYVFPIFDPRNESDDSHKIDYWFRSFFQMAHSVSLNQYCLSVDFADMLDPIFNIDNSDKHTLCTDYQAGMNRGEVYLFSEPKYLRTTPFNSAINFRDGILNWESDEEQKTIGETLQEVIEIFDLQDFRIETIHSLQITLLHTYGIFWLPILKNKLY